jgi:hypothetical protein
MRYNGLFLATALAVSVPAAATTVTFEGVADPNISSPQELPNGGYIFGDLYGTNISQSPVRPWFIVPSASSSGPSNGTDYVRSSWAYFGSANPNFNRFVLKSFDIATIDGSSFNVQYETYWLREIIRSPLAIGPNFQTVQVGKVLNSFGFMGATPDREFAIDNIVFEAIPGIPEPATWLQLGLGIGAIGAVGRLARRKVSVRIVA